jgi:Ca-activated chloride channel homolog
LVAFRLNVESDSIEIFIEIDVLLSCECCLLTFLARGELSLYNQTIMLLISEQFSPSVTVMRDARRLIQLAMIITLAFLCSTIPASTQERTAAPIDEEIVRVDTNLIPVDVTVTNAEGQLVRNLRPEDFRVFENNIERPISFFNIEHRGGVERPVSAVFVLDVSGSMRIEEIARLRSAVRLFAERLARNSSVFAVMSFGMEVRLLQSFTSDLGRLERAFDRLEREPNGLSSHAYDAVDDAIRLIVRRAPRTRERRLMKRVVIVVTDGFPVGDRVSPRTVIERANAAETSVFTVTLPSFSRLSNLSAALEPPRPLPTPLDVSGLAERTGGSIVYATDRDFENVFRRIAEEVTATYSLAFYPLETTRADNQFHTIRVEVRPGLFVRQNRAGYRAASSN